MLVCDGFLELAVLITCCHPQSSSTALPPEENEVSKIRRYSVLSSIAAHIPPPNDKVMPSHVPRVPPAQPHGRRAGRQQSALEYRITADTPALLMSPHLPDPPLRRICQNPGTPAPYTSTFLRNQPVAPRIPISELTGLPTVPPERNYHSGSLARTEV